MRSDADRASDILEAIAKIRERITDGDAFAGDEPAPGDTGTRRYGDKGDTGTGHATTKLGRGADHSNFEVEGLSPYPHLTLLVSQPCYILI